MGKKRQSNINKGLKNDGKKVQNTERKANRAIGGFFKDNNPFDITKELKLFEKYATFILKKIEEISKKIANFIKDNIFNSFKYSSIVLAVFSIVVVGTLLFGKNKYNILLVVFYFFIAAVILFCIIAKVALLLILWEKFLKFFVLVWNFIKSLQNIKVEIKPLIRNAVLLIEIAIALGILLFGTLMMVAIAWITKKLCIANSYLFITINQSYGAPKVGVNAIETFGSVVREILENC